MTSGTTAGRLPRRARVERLMGTVVSIHVVGRGCDSNAAALAADGCLAELRDIERVFSTFIDDSDVSRLRRGEVTLADADPRVAAVAVRCAEAADATGGMFSAWWRGWFDPTGLVKGWGVDQAAQNHLAPLLRRADVAAVGINAGGDLRLFTAAESDWTWQVGVADPGRPDGVVAALRVRDGGVATSGLAERGTHIIDPRTGVPVDTVSSATVVAADLTTADIWATTAVVAGADDLGWIRRAPSTTGLVVAADGTVRRWVDQVEIVAQPSESLSGQRQQERASGW